MDFSGVRMHSRAISQSSARCEAATGVAVFGEGYCATGSVLDGPLMLEVGVLDR